MKALNKMKIKILIVDDEFLIRKALQLGAESRGHIVRIAENATQGLKLWREMDPDLVFLDVLMPDRSGLSVLSDKPKNSKAKVILISAHDDLNERETGKSKADLFIKKPFPDIFQLIEQAESLLINRSVLKKSLS